MKSIWRAERADSSKLLLRGIAACRSVCEIKDKISWTKGAAGYQIPVLIVYILVYVHMPWYQVVDSQ